MLITGAADASAVSEAEENIIGFKDALNYDTVALSIKSANRTGK